MSKNIIDDILNSIGARDNPTTLSKATSDTEPPLIGVYKTNANSKNKLKEKSADEFKNEESKNKVENPETPSNSGDTPIFETTSLSNKKDLWTLYEIPSTSRGKDTMSNTISKDIPVEEYDDLPDEETMEAQANYDAFENILYPSETMIQGILKYVKDNNIPSIPKEQDTQFTGTSPFIFEDKKYILTEKDAQIIYAEILSMNNLATLSKAASRRPNTLKHLLDGVPEDQKKFKHPILLDMEYDIIVKLIQKALSMILNNVLEKDPGVEEMKTSTNSFAVNIGRTLMGKPLW